jgi:DNA-directed RNA polymerase subunit M/transcription elongation factor TFIIS
MFCPKCGSILTPHDGIMKCSCGYFAQTKDEIVKEKVEHPGDDIIIREGINPLATHDHVCKRCACKKAIFVSSQIAIRETWNSSETDRPAFICGRCGFKEFV